jgi:hypothetical protein
MSTLCQIEANRRNAQKSTGPTSVTGKAASSMNALKSGLHAKSLVLPSEKLADLEDLIDAYYRHHRPASPDACGFVDDLIRCEWTLRRLDRAETQMWRFQSEDTFGDPEKFPLGKAATYNPNSFSKLQYRIDATRRARDRALLALEKLQAKAAAAPVPGTDKTDMSFRRSLLETRCQPCLSPVSPAPDPPTLIPSPLTTFPRIGFVPPTTPDAPSQPVPAPPNLDPRGVPAAPKHLQIR